MSNGDNKCKTKALIATLACANTALYGLPYMKGQFYEIELAALSLDNAQLSRLFSIYGIIAIIAYLVGGVIADKFSGKRLLLSALMTSAVLHISVILRPPYYILCLIFAAMSVTSIMMFYPASMKLLAGLGKNDTEGSVFGDYLAMVSVFSIAVASTGWVMLRVLDDSTMVFNIIILLYAFLHIIAVVMFVKFYPESQEVIESSRFRLNEVIQIAGNTNLWLIVVLIFTNYMVLCILTYVIPYLSNVYEMKASDVLLLSIIRVNVLAAIVAPLAGRLVDYTNSTVGLFRISCVITTVMIPTVIVSCFIRIPAAIVITVILIISLVIMAAKSLNFVMLTEIGIPTMYMGTTIGLASFLGYSPDAFIFSICGSVLDNFGISGYPIIFGIVLFCALIGLLAGNRLHRNMRS